MKICIFGDAQSVHVQRLAGGLVERGESVHVVTHKPAAIDGVSVERFRVPPPGLTNPRRWEARRVRYLNGFFERFDVVNVQFLHDWGFTPDMLGGGCLVATAWGSDIVPPPGEDAPDHTVVKSRKMMLQHATVATACGPTFARIVADFAGLQAVCVDVIPFGVDLRRFRQSAVRPPKETGAMRVGFFKGFRAVYGAPYLMEAIPYVLKACPDTVFEFVGDGLQLTECQRMASELGVGNATVWLGRQAHERIPRWIARCYVTVIPSVFEAFGVAALESSAMRIPVVASDVCGLRDTVRHEQTGLLVSPGNPQAIADAVVRLLKDSALRVRLGESGRAMVERDFEARAVHAQWAALFERAVDSVSAMV